MWSKIFIEEGLRENSRTKNILDRFSNAPIEWIDSYESVFQKVKKPYLQKRDSLQLFLAQKKGSLVKLAPDTYGLGKEAHYYFIHAYNCIYECQYCYLQGYFQSPDIVLFLNHEEILNEIQTTYKNSSDPVWFHAGEFSDSLALSHLTNEWPLYWEAFEKMPHATLELRTKSANIKSIQNLTPLKNIIISFSLSPEDAVKKFDLKTAPLKARLQAMSVLAEKKFKLGIHLDPIIVTEDIFKNYQSLTNQILQYVQPEAISYISLGVVRFTKDVYHQIQKNYPQSEMLGGPFYTSFDNKVRYPRPLRFHILKEIENILIQSGFKKEQLYLCMERE